MNIAITGTSRGLGKALAAHFCAAGHTVFGCSRKAEVEIHPNYTHIPADLRESGGAKEFFRQIRRSGRPLDALVNNAGSAVMNHFMLTPEATSRAILELNVVALLACSREAVPLMNGSEHPSPSILNFSSVAVAWSLPGQLVYAASKSAVEQATRIMSRELAPNNVRVNALGLPAIRTALTRTVPREKIDSLIQRQTIQRQCEIDDILGPVGFLLSPEARFVTGETIYLGGVA